MNVVFIGSSFFGLKCLKACHDIPEVNIIGVITAPRKFSISYQTTRVTNVLHRDIKTFAKSKNIPTYEIKKNMNDLEIFQHVKSWKPDIFLVSGWYHMIPKRFLDFAPAYGLHASLLPDYSGGAPLTWAIINGEKKTGITFFQMDNGVDSGPILGQKSQKILVEDTIGSLYEKIANQGIELVKEVLPQIARGNHTPKPQDETKRRLFPQRNPLDGIIDWTMSANKIYDFIRAQTRPYPGAFSYFFSKKVIIWQSYPLIKKNYKLEPGKLLLIKRKLIAGCGKNTALEIISINEGENDINPISWAQSKNVPMLNLQ